MNPTQSQLEQKIAELKGDIRLLERQKTELFENNTKVRRAQETEELDTRRRLTELKTIKEKVQNSIKELTLQRLNIEDSVKITKKDIERFASVEMGKAQNEAEMIRAEANKLLEIAQNNSDYWTRKGEELKILEINLRENQKNLDAEKEKQDAWDAEFDNKKMDLQKRIEAAERELFNAVSARDEAKLLAESAWAEFNEVTKKKVAIDKQISEAMIDLEKRQNNVTIREKAVTLREDESANKNEALRIREVRVADREEISKRAYKEIISKGGKIDGG